MRSIKSQLIVKGGSSKYPSDSRKAAQQVKIPNPSRTSQEAGSKHLSTSFSLHPPPTQDLQNCPEEPPHPHPTAPSSCSWKSGRQRAPSTFLAQLSWPSSPPSSGSSLFTSCSPPPSPTRPHTLFPSQGSTPPPNSPTVFTKTPAHPPQPEAHPPPIAPRQPRGCNSPFFLIIKHKAQRPHPQLFLLGLAHSSIPLPVSASPETKTSRFILQRYKSTPQRKSKLSLPWEDALREARKMGRGSDAGCPGVLQIISGPKGKNGSKAF